MAKNITRKFKKSKQVSESFSVLKSDNTTKHGEFISYFWRTSDDNNSIQKGDLTIDDFVKLKGSYNNGKKTGKWIEYSKPNVLDSEGNYLEGEKIGIWLTYKEHGQVIEQFDYYQNKKLPPRIQINIEYPSDAVESGVEGKVQLKYKVNPNCSVSDVVITNGLSTECDKAALESIEKLSEYMKRYSTKCEEKTESIELEFKLH